MSEDHDPIDFLRPRRRAPQDATVNDSGFAGGTQWLSERGERRTASVTSNNPSPLGGDSLAAAWSSAYSPTPNSSVPLVEELSSGLLPAIQLSGRAYSRQILSPEVQEAVKEAMSRRIPDFVMKIVEVVEYDGTPYKRLDIVREKVVMIVEIKPRMVTFDDSRRILSQTIRIQAKEQAIHAFQESADLARIGCIVAIGDLWYYTEYDRKVLKYADPGNGPDDAYVDPSDKSTRSGAPEYKPSREGLYADIEPYFRDHNMLDLNTPQSDEVLQKIVARLRELSGEYWEK